MGVARSGDRYSGSLVVAQWAVGLIRSTSKVLLDREMDADVANEIRKAIEADRETKIADLHLIRVGNSEFAVVLSVVSDHPQQPEYYKDLLRIHEELVHISVEVHTCPSHRAEEAGHALRPRIYEQEERQS